MHFMEFTTGNAPDGILPDYVLEYTLPEVYMTLLVASVLLYGRNF